MAPGAASCLVAVLVQPRCVSRTQARGACRFTRTAQQHALRGVTAGLLELIMHAMEAAAPTAHQGLAITGATLTYGRVWIYTIFI